MGESFQILMAMGGSPLPVLLADGVDGRDSRAG